MTMTIGFLMAWLLFGWVDQGWIETGTGTPTTNAVISDEDGIVRTMDGPDSQPPKP